MFQKIKFLPIISSLIIFSPIFITISKSFEVYTNRIYHVLIYYFQNNKIIYENEFLLTLPLNLIFIPIIGLFFYKNFLTKKIFWTLFILLLVVNLLNFQFIYIFYKNSISILIAISSLIIFDSYFKKNNFSFEQVFLIPISIIIIGLVPNLFVELESSYGDQILIYFFPNIVIFNALQYFSFLFLVFSSLSYKKFSHLFIINLITLYICIITENYTSTIIFVIFIFFRLTYFISNDKLKILLINFSTIFLILSIFSYYIFFLAVPFELLPIQLKDRYLMIYDYVSKFDIYTLVIPIHSNYDLLINGLHNLPLELLSRFGLIITSIYYIFFLKYIFKLKDIEPMLYIMISFLFFIANSITTLFLHPYTLICFSYIICFFKNRRNGY